MELTEGEGETSVHMLRDIGTRLSVMRTVMFGRVLNGKASMAATKYFTAAIDDSRGRRFPRTSTRGRSEYQRDRDRIIHSTLRRLEYKTRFLSS